MEIIKMRIPENIKVQGDIKHVGFQIGIGFVSAGLRIIPVMEISQVIFEFYIGAVRELQTEEKRVVGRWCPFTEPYRKFFDLLFVFKSFLFIVKRKFNFISAVNIKTIKIPDLQTERYTQVIVPEFFLLSGILEFIDEPYVPHGDA